MDERAKPLVPCDLRVAHHHTVEGVTQRDGGFLHRARPLSGMGAPIGFFEELWPAGLLLSTTNWYDQLQGIEWERQAVDAAMTKAPLGREA